MMKKNEEEEEEEEQGISMAEAVRARSTRCAWPGLAANCDAI